ncbi:MAG: type II toxin-antitoxin system RelE/ParE family toxin [Candidatus Deferrimicrobium sp.]
MEWEVLFQDEFDAEFRALEQDLQDELLAHALLLREFGPNLGRPTVDSLKGSRHTNMKELRFGWSVRRGVASCLCIRSPPTGHPAGGRRQARDGSEAVLPASDRRSR